MGGGTGECIGAVGSIDIGDNVFIGVNTVILRNTQIGSNIIIGAGSIVSGMLEDNGVYAGNPAKRIMTIEEFYQKRKDRRQTEIANILSRIDTTNKEEIWKYLREYSCFFKDAPADVQRQIMLDTGYLEKCKTFYANNAPSYKIENFIN